MSGDNMMEKEGEKNMGILRGIIVSIFVELIAFFFCFCTKKRMK
jgi:hypothetical protein